MSTHLTSVAVLAVGMLVPASAAAEVSSGQRVACRTETQKMAQIIVRTRGKGGNYAGKITDLDDKKTYDGVMTVAGDTVKMKGCVMKLFCQSQTWTRL